MCDITFRLLFHAHQTLPTIICQIQKWALVFTKQPRTPVRTTHQAFAAPAKFSEVSRQGVCPGEHLVGEGREVRVSKDSTRCRNLCTSFLR